MSIPLVPNLSQDKRVVMTLYRSPVSYATRNINKIWAMWF